MAFPNLAQDQRDSPFLGWFTASQNNSHYNEGFYLTDNSAIGSNLKRHRRARSLRLVMTF